MARGDTKRYSADDLIEMRQRGDFVTVSAGAPTVELDAEFWGKASVVMPVGKSSVHLRLDSDVLDWFKAQGKGHLTRMNAVLRSYVEAHKSGRTR